ncbi:MAG: S8 family serine peptidase, partial [Actinomycetota bacterium]
MADLLSASRVQSADLGPSRDFCEKKARDARRRSLWTVDSHGNRHPRIHRKDSAMRTNSTTHDSTVLGSTNGNRARNVRLAIGAWTGVAAVAATALVVTSLSTGSGSNASDDDVLPRADAAAIAPDAAPLPDIVVDDEPPSEPDLPPPAVPPSPDQLDVVVDATLAPASDTIDGLEPGDAPRPTARLRSTGGTESDIVLGELAVAFHDTDELDAFLDRRHGTVLDTTEPGTDGDPTDYLVAVDAATADLDRVAADMLAIEPHHDGEFAASDPDAVALLAIAANEAAVHGTDVTLNWLTEPTGIREGTATEDPARPDVFEWSWISSTKPQQTGIDAAWQLLYGRGGVGNKVRMLIADNGFFPNADFPAVAEIHGRDWRTPNSDACSGGNPCPFHGTDVTMAAMGRIDNGFGTAGPAAPVAELVAYDRGGSMRKQLKTIRNLAKDRSVDIVNMSFSGNVTAFQGSAERRYGRWFRGIRDDHGVLSFASAGNAGVDVDSNDALTIPCEIEGVVCVGGVDTAEPTARHDNSNYGSKTGGGSVEIYGPHCVIALSNPDVPGDGTTKSSCGTSFASPVVAGVAALVMAANPNLGPKQVWQVMKDTAHTDSLGAEVTGHTRRVDAYRAVATAMGRHYEFPTLTIESPTDDDVIGPFDFIDLVASAENFAGLDLPIQWRRAGGDVVNATPTTDPVGLSELGSGRHTFIATATDVMGIAATKTLTIDVANTPPAASITSPAANTYRYTVEPVVLDASSSDPEAWEDPVPDANASWTVTRSSDGSVVFEATGHRSTIPANTLGAGDHEVRFVAVDVDGSASTDVALLTMLEVPEGESLPDATILAPDHNAEYITGGEYASVRLLGTASDTQDGPLSGTRMRWIAEQGDERIVLCEGSDLV